jgi:hypothetical protein
MSTTSTPNSSALKATSARRLGKHALPDELRGAASREAQRLAAAILEVLAGVRTPSDAAAALNISTPRYYLFEQRALVGMVTACEPRRTGPGHSPTRQLALLEKEVTRLKQECARQQALLRASQRTIGLAPPPTPKPAKGQKPGKPSRQRRPAVRALKAAAALRPEPPADNSSSATSPAVLQQRATDPALPPAASPPAAGA